MNTVKLHEFEPGVFYIVTQEETIQEDPMVAVLRLDGRYEWKRLSEPDDVWRYLFVTTKVVTAKFVKLEDYESLSSEKKTRDNIPLSEIIPGLIYLASSTDYNHLKYIKLDGGIYVSANTIGDNAEWLSLTPSPDLFNIYCYPNPVDQVKPKDPYAECVDDLFRVMTNRGGFDEWWYSVKPELRSEIRGRVIETLKGYFHE